MFKNIFAVFIGALFLIADQTIKSFLIHSLTQGEGIPVLKNIFHITLVFNSGCAFGLLKGQSNLFFLVVSVLAIAFVVYISVRCQTPSNSFFTRLAAMMLVSGAASNLIDRLRFGYVVDFLDFRIWPVFNIGDAAITIGIAIFIVQFFYASHHL